MAESTIWYKIYYEGHQLLDDPIEEYLLSVRLTPSHYWADFCNEVVRVNTGFAVSDVKVYQNEDCYQQRIELKNRTSRIGDGFRENREQPIIVTGSRIAKRFPEIRSDSSVRIPNGLNWDVTSEQQCACFKIPREIIDGSGVSRKDNLKDLVLFNRTACKKQIDFIKKNVIEDQGCGFIHGQPGTGKSATSFLFALSLRHEWDIVWIHTPQSMAESAFVLRIRGDDIRKLRVWTHEAHLLFASGTRKTLLILDSLNLTLSHSSILYARGLDWVHGDSNRRFLNVSSMGAIGTLGCDDGQVPVIRHAVEGWELEDYLEAIKIDELWKSVEHAFLKVDDSVQSVNLANADVSQREKLVGSKFFYAGTSARYMFSLSRDRLEQLVSEGIRSIPRTRLEAGSAGVYTQEARHRLFATSVGADGSVDISGFVSQYVARKVGCYCSPNIVRFLWEYERLARNRAVKGWAFEALFFAFIVNNSLQLLSLPKGGVGRRTPIRWKCLQERDARVQEFDPKNCQEIPDNTWMMPMSANQPGYDAVIFLKKSCTVRFVQITISDKHDLKLAPMTALVNRMKDVLHQKVSKVEIIFVIPDTSRAAKFVIDPVVDEGPFIDLFPSWSGPGQVLKNTKIVVMEI